MGKPTLFVAAGHGGKDTGAVSRGRVERDEMINFVAGMRNWVRLNGKKTGVGGIVFIDDQLELVGTVKAVQEWKPDNNDLAVEFHLNQNTGADDTGGALVICDQENGKAQNIGLNFLQHWCKATGIRNTGAQLSKDFAAKARNWDDFGLTRPTNFGGIIVELGCIACDAPDMAAVQNRIMQAVAAEVLWDLFFSFA